MDKLISICPVAYFTGTSLMNIYLRLMGAKIGKNCYVNTAAIDIFDLLKLGDNVSICTDTHLRGYTIEDGYLKIGSIELEDNAFVSTRCCLSYNSKMEKNSSLDDFFLQRIRKLIAGILRSNDVSNDFKAVLFNLLRLRDVVHAYRSFN